MTDWLLAWVAVAAAASLYGCTTVQPNFGPEKSIQETYQTTPTLPNAVKVADSMKIRYMEKVESQLVWERLTGLTLIGLSTVGADLVLRGVARSEVVGMGVLAGGAYAASNWLASKPQQYIYAAGANAVQCAVDTMQPLMLAYPDRRTLAVQISQIRSKVSALEATLDLNFSAGSSRTLPRVVRARAAVERAKALLPMGSEALRRLDSAGGQLRTSLSNIELQVTNAVVAISPNLQSLLDSLGSALPVPGGKIIGAPAPGIPLDTTTVKTSGDDEKLVAPTNDIETLLAQIEQVVDRVKIGPSEDRLRQCNVNLQQAGLSMSVTPAELALEPGKSAGVLVSGGVLPYRAAWIGARPAADQVELQLESGLGVVAVTAKATARPGAYTLLVLDASRGRETLAVVIKAANTKDIPKTPPVVSSATGSASADAAACTKVPKVQRVQDALLKQGTKTAKVNGLEKPLVADGCVGPVTTQAMRNFMKAQLQNPQDNQIPSGDKLLDDVAALLGV